MNLVKFLIVGALFSIVLGELGKFPFGASSVAISVLDLMVGLTLTSFLIWKVCTKEKIQIPAVFRWLGIFWLVAIVSLLASLAFLDFQNVAQGSLYLIRFIVYSSLLIVGYNLNIQGLFNFSKLSSLFICLGIALAILGLLQLWLYPVFEDPPFYLTDFGFDPHRGRLTSTLLDPNFLGAILSLSLGLVIYKLITGAPKRWWTVVILLVTSILLTLSRSAYLLSVISTGLIIISLRHHLKIKNLALPGLLLGILVLVVAFNPIFTDRIMGAIRLDNSSRERIESWGKGLAIAQAKPLLGVGFNNLRSASQELNLVETYSEEGGHSGAGIDSSLLLVLATTGIFGLVVYLIFWGQVLNQLRLQKNPQSVVALSLLIGMLVNSQFINSLFFPSLMVFYFLMLGVTLES